MIFHIFCFAIFFWQPTRNSAPTSCKIADAKYNMDTGCLPRVGGNALRSFLPYCTCQGNCGSGVALTSHQLFSFICHPSTTSILPSLPSRLDYWNFEIATPLRTANVRWPHREQLPLMVSQSGLPIWMARPSHYIPTQVSKETQSATDLYSATSFLHFLALHMLSM